MVSLNLSRKQHETDHSLELTMMASDVPTEADVDIDMREVYFLIIHFLSTGPCRRTYAQLWTELLEHRLLPRRYHAWYSRNGKPSGDENDDESSLPLDYSSLVRRYSHIQKDHLVRLLKQLLLNCSRPSHGIVGGNFPNAADVPTLLGTGSLSLLASNLELKDQRVFHLPAHSRWPHIHADQVRGLSLREIGGGFSKHHRSPSVRAACYAIAKPATLLLNMEIKKRLRGHQNAVYCAIFDRSGRHVITGSDDRLVKIWSMETAFCLASCRGHEGDITDLAVSSNNALVASASNDFIIRVWRLPDGLPISVLRGHTGAVTAIAFSPRPSAIYQLLSSSDDGTCRIWDARYSQTSPRVFVSKPPELTPGKPNLPSSSTSAQPGHRILCCAYNASGTVFVSGSSDTFARVWNACKVNAEDAEQQNHEIDLLSGHENDVNYVQFSGCAAVSRSTIFDSSKEDNLPKFKNSWFTHDNIVTCSRDGSAIIWIPRSRRSHGKVGRWTRAYHLRVPPPPVPPQPPRGGPRQRFQPTPRGVNMIIWSLDNRFVLAAIMDCRICVWNASDGSLVHSLMGHSESTFVLDVHPFNPRIAMSAGYDGKTIIWDIWEGTPVRIYETGQFKLVDGKFSPDGTSIVLSDEVGQILIIATGQGDSLENAKYDQFFLGDYRPLIQDAHGNILDQETQLPPHRRNMQDLLCDSSLIPYPEPYQSMYQRRRLGTLGIEWHPTSLKLAVGPIENANGVVFQIPFIDPERWVDPMPEFIDAIDWEQENEIQSEDTDSEYDAAEEFSSEADHESISVGVSGDSQYSLEDSEEVNNSSKDGLRRSRRKPRKSEVEEVTTSSGRRVKRRNMDDRDDVINQRTRKPNRKSKRKSSKTNLLRPQRRAARNALSLFSQITEVSSEGEEEDAFSETDVSSESGLYSQSNESDNSIDKSHGRSTKLKNVVVEGENHEDISASSSQVGNLGTKRRLVVKFSIRDRKEAVPENKIHLHQEDNAVLEENGRIPNGTGSASYERGESSVCQLEHGARDGTFQGERWDLEKLVDHPVVVPYGYNGGGTIKWGEVKTRSTKRPRLAEALSGDDKTVIQHLKSKDIDSPKENGHHEKHNEEKDHGERSVASVLEAFANSRVEYQPPPPPAETDSKSNSPDEETQRADQLTDPASVPPQDEEARLVYRRLKVKMNKLELTGQPVEETEPIDYVENKEHEGIGRSRPSDNSKGLSSEDPYAKKYNPVYRRLSSSRRRGRTGAESSSPNEEEDTDGDDERYHHRRPGHANDMNGCEQFLSGEKRRSSSRMAVGLRSLRSRRENYSSASEMSRRRPPNSMKKMSWLLLSEHEEGYRYIPQLGDEVAYLRQGHEEYMRSTFGHEAGPWKLIKSGSLQAVEFCRIESLDYSTLPGSGESCCKLTLQFIDPASCAFGKAFKLTLPELVAFPDFLVERTRYEASVARAWTHRDKCRVWWRDEDGHGGGWWEGRVMAVRPKSNEFTDSPWERFVVQYKSDSSGLHLHSPWELHDPPLAGGIPSWEHPRLDDTTTALLLSSLDKLQQDYHEIYHKLNQVALKSDFLNRFPVALSPEVIRQRADSGYYRTVAAVQHDASVMLSNAASYLAKSADLSKVRRLSDAITHSLSSL